MLSAREEELCDVVKSCCEGVIRNAAAPPRHHSTRRRLVSSLSDGAFVLLSAAKPVAIGYAITCASPCRTTKTAVFSTVDALSPSGDFSRPSRNSRCLRATARDARLAHAGAGARRRAGRALRLGEKAAAALQPTMRELRRRYDFSHIDVLQFHGNAGSRANRLGWMHILREGLGCSVSVLDYRGYGGSEGSPTEQGLLADGEAAAAWAAARGGERRKLVLWGESIGSGVAAAVASRTPPPAALVVEAGFSSCADAAAAVPVAAGSALRLLRFGGQRGALPRSLPTLSIHGRLDEIAPIELGRKLHAALPEGAAFVELPHAGHNDVPYQDPSAYLKAIAAFFERLDAE